MPFDLESALATSPYPQKLAAAAVLASEGKYVQAVYELGETLSVLELSGAPLKVIAPFLQLSAESLRNAAARFASSSPYSDSRVDLRVRIGWLEQAAEQYSRLKDVPNQAHTLVALGTANLRVGEPLAAMHQFKQALNLASKSLVFNITEVQTVFSHLADALQTSFSKFAIHQSGSHYNLAVEGAAYRYLAGNPGQAMADLDSLHGKYLEAAQLVHRSHVGDDRAFRLLVQGIYWGLVTGHTDVLINHADLLVYYATQAGNVEAISIYENAIALREEGLREDAQRLVLGQAQKVLASFSGALDLNLFHDIIDERSDYQVDFVDRELKGLDPSDPRIPEHVDAKRNAALLNLSSWAQTLDGVVPQFSGLGDRKMLEELVSRGFKVSLQRASVAFVEATRQAELYRRATKPHPIPPLNPGVIRFISETRWQDPMSAQLAYAQLAQDFQCTPAEVELAFSPRGMGTPATERIRRLLGEYDFDQVRREVMTRGLLGQLKDWTEGREGKGRR